MKRKLPYRGARKPPKSVLRLPDLEHAKNMHSAAIDTPSTNSALTLSDWGRVARLPGLCERAAVMLQLCGAGAVQTPGSDIARQLHSIHTETFPILDAMMNQLEGPGEA